MRPFLPILIFLAAAGCGPAREQTNLILITVDTLRADRLGCYGYEPGQTPIIDGLAAGGTKFTHVLSPAPLTLPSHATILTGRYPPSHGLRDNGSGSLGKEIVTLAEILREQGWRTGAVVSSFVLDPRFGLDQGFETYFAPGDGPDGSPGLFRFREIKAGEVTDRALAWIGEGPEPFFLWIHYFDPHADYQPSEPYLGRFPGRPYDGEVAYVDTELGRLLDRLARTGMNARTLIALTSDHGEGLGEHGEPTHGIFLYGSTLNVPLILAGPKIPAGICSRSASLADCLPTILGILGLEIPAGVEGKDLHPFPGGDEPDRELYAETLAPKYNLGWSALYCLVRGNLKYIRAPVPELYDLKKDPAEIRNLAETDRDLTAEMEKRLQELEKQLGQVPAGQARMDGTAWEQLHSLGYGTGGAAISFQPGPDPKEMAEILPLLSRSESLLRAGSWEETAAVLQKILSRDPGNQVARERMVIVLRLQGRRGQALEELDKLLRQRPDQPRLLAIKAALLLQEGNAEQAALAAARAETLAGDDPEILVIRGKTLRGQGRLEEAEERFNRALELFPGYTAALTNLADLHCRRGEWEQARLILEDIASRFPTQADSHYNLGVFSLARGDRPRARGCFQRALSLDPNHGAAREKLESLGDTPGSAGKEGSEQR